MRLGRRSSTGPQQPEEQGLQFPDPFTNGRPVGDDTEGSQIMSLTLSPTSTTFSFGDVQFEPVEVEEDTPLTPTTLAGTDFEMWVDDDDEVPQPPPQPWSKMAVLAVLVWTVFFLLAARICFRALIPGDRQFRVDTIAKVVANHVDLALDLSENLLEVAQVSEGGFRTIQ